MSKVQAKTVQTKTLQTKTLQQLPALEPIPKKAKPAVAPAATPLAPVPSAAQFLSPADARFVAALEEKEAFPAAPTPEQRTALVLAASKASAGLIKATAHAGFDTKAVAQQLTTTARLIWALGKTDLSLDERDLLKTAVEGSNLAADALAADEPRLMYSAIKERAFNELARTTHHAGLTTLPGTVSLSSTAQTRAMTFQRSKLEHVRALAPVVNDIKTGMGQKIDGALKAIEPFTNREALCAYLFGLRNEPNFKERLITLGLDMREAGQVADEVRSWTRPLFHVPCVTRVEERLIERHTHLTQMREPFASNKSAVDAFADLLAAYPDMASTWCFAAGFANTLSLPLRVTDAQVDAMQPAERAVHDALKKRTGWKHAVRELAPTIAASIAIGSALAAAAVPLVAAGVATAAIVGAPRVVSAHSNVEKKKAERSVGLASDGSVERAKNERIAASAAVAVDALTAGVASKLGAGRLITHYAMNAGVGAAATTLTTVFDPEFWKQEEGHALLLMEATVTGVASGLLGTAAGLGMHRAAKLVFMRNSVSPFRVGSVVDIEAHGVRTTDKVKAFDPIAGTITTEKHGVFQVREARLFALYEASPLNRWKLDEKGNPMLESFVAPPPASASTFDKTKLSAAMRFVFDNGTPAQQQLMRKIGNAWLERIGTEVITNPRLVRLFDKFGDPVIKWMRKHADEAHRLISIDARVGGGVLDAFETMSFDKLVKQLRLPSNPWN